MEMCMEKQNCHSSTEMYASVAATYVIVQISYHRYLFRLAPKIPTRRVISNSFGANLPPLQSYRISPRRLYSSTFDESSIPDWNAIDEFPIPPIPAVELYGKFGAESDLCSPLRPNLCLCVCLRTRYIDLSIRYLCPQDTRAVRTRLPPFREHEFPY